MHILSGGPERATERSAPLGGLTLQWILLPSAYGHLHMPVPEQLTNSVSIGIVLGRAKMGRKRSRPRQRMLPWMLP